ncbi:MAG TPA: adenosylcobalamin-dependent ribonucleoside-diphosphate reductase [Woeseiaceae bacterium]|nr:adenosylcobalamin-dependent ribonucleoside-diphosphate reductase [Woeseiaceae bacterium]
MRGDQGELTAVGRTIWQAKYRLDEGAAPEATFEATRRRVSRAIAQVEADPEHWEAAFADLLADFRFLPGGRIWAGAGSDRDVTLFNCFVAGAIQDSMEGILDALRETALTLQQGGGVGLDFSTLRPAGQVAQRTGQVASGPVSFMHVWDALCRTILSSGTRRGAMMGTLHCEHPDVEAFVDAKRDGTALRNFNLSVLVSDAFMQAVADDAEWVLRYPPGAATAGTGGNGPAESGRRVPARALWRRIAEAAHAGAEPGVLFVDTVNRENNLWYCETIRATNPCGEIPLPPYGACNLGSINLPVFIKSPFSRSSSFDWPALSATVETAVRFLDDVIDASRFPLPAQAERARATRRIGLGITGLADALVMLGLHYDSEAARDLARRVMAAVRDTAYAASVRLAREKGPFPLLDRERYLAGPFVRRLPEELRGGIAAHGIRNSHLLAIAPAGTISLLAGNVSSGIEPIYALEATRDVRGPDLGIRTIAVRDFAYEAWLAAGGDPARPDPAFVTSAHLRPEAHLEMQATLQPFVDNAISKTVTLDANATVEDVERIFTRARELGLKGCTVFRPGTERGEVLRGRDAPHCCHVEREAD